MFPQLASALFIASLLAGCLTTSDEGPETDFSTLADLRSCELVAFEDIRLECRQDAAEPAILESRPPGGVGCSSVADDGTFRVVTFLDLGSGETHMEITTAQEMSFQVIVRYGPDESGEADDGLATWHHDGDQSMVRLPDAPQNGRYEARFYQTHITSNTSALQGANLAHIWEWADGVPWPIQKIEADGGPYFFHSPDASLFGSVDRGLPILMMDRQFVGQDFAFDFDYVKVRNVEAAYALFQQATC